MKKERAEELIKKFGDYRIAVIGDVVLDHYVRGVVERINPEAPVPVLRVTEQESRSGGAGNVAKNVAALGAEATLLSVVGVDEAAKEIETAAQYEGYQTVLLPDPSRPTIRKVRHLVGSQQMLRVDFEETHDIPRDVEDALIAALRDVAADIDGIFVSDYAKGVVSRRLAEAILDVASKHDLLVGTDVKPSRAPYFVGATFVSPNVKEAYEYLGLDQFDRSLNATELAQEVYKRLCSDVYLTLSAEGMYVYCGGEDGVHVPQEHVVEVSDVSGAGDTAATVILLSLLAGATPQEAAELANAGGAVAVGKVGTVGPTPKELLTMIMSRV